MYKEYLNISILFIYTIISILYGILYIRLAARFRLAAKNCGYCIVNIIHTGLKNVQIFFSSCNKYS